MSDPLVPSAIMQTMGALLGIYIAVYVLALQYILPIKRQSKAYKFITVANGTFYSVVLSGTATIVFSTFWLYSLSILHRSTPLLGISVLFLFF